MKLKWIALILASTLLLSSCGFQPRQASDVPSQLHTLFLQTTKPYSDLITQLTAMLNSLNIKLVKQRSHAPYTLQILRITYTQSNPSITTTTLAVTLTYTLVISVQLISQSGRIIIPNTTLRASRSISQNPSQVYTPGNTTLSKQELRRDVISQLYYLLTANNTRKALSHVH